VRPARSRGRPAVARARNPAPSAGRLRLASTQTDSSCRAGVEREDRIGHGVNATTDLRQKPGQRTALSAALRTTTESVDRDRRDRAVAAGALPDPRWSSVRMTGTHRCDSGAQVPVARWRRPVATLPSAAREETLTAVLAHDDGDVVPHAGSGARARTRACRARPVPARTQRASAAMSRACVWKRRHHRRFVAQQHQRPREASRAPRARRRTSQDDSPWRSTTGKLAGEVDVAPVLRRHLGELFGAPGQWRVSRNDRNSVSEAGRGDELRQLAGSSPAFQKVATALAACTADPRRRPPPHGPR
jgi:hypothetical protein